ncbi:hypothetical protein N8329_03810 [Crocinitomicaceae bacterium]|nr:hypothetical protein [Crocinitomicaceae bacterium]
MKFLFAFSISIILISCSRGEINGLPENYVQYLDLQDSLGNNLFDDFGQLIDSNLQLASYNFEGPGGSDFRNESILIYAKSDSLFKRPIPAYHDNALFSGYLIEPNKDEHNNRGEILWFCHYKHGLLDGYCVYFSANQYGSYINYIEYKNGKIFAETDFFDGGLDKNLNKIGQWYFYDIDAVKDHGKYGKKSKVNFDDFRK